MTARARASRCLETLRWCAAQRLKVAKSDFLYHRMRCDDIGIAHAIADIRQADEEMKTRERQIQGLGPA